MTRKRAVSTLFRGIDMPNRTASLLVSVAWGAMMIAAAASAQTRPTGGEVRAGDAAIGVTGNGLLITQGSDRAVIDWNSFSVGQGGRVDFRNGDGATLNRVTGDSVSRIDGSLTASGSVYVMNGAGVVIGATGVVDVGGSFVASTLDVSDADFMNAGDLLFAGDSDASVINFGRIGALGGDVALIGARVENRGTIVAQDGTAALAAGYEVLMRDAALADGQFVVRIGGEGTQALNAGRIEAAAVELRANQGNVLALAGNTEGLIRAEGIATTGGRIFLTAPGGTVRVEAPVVAPAGDVILNARDITINGLVDVSALDAVGGSITVEGESLYLSSVAELDASGTAGGLIRVGGDLQGGRVPGFGAAMENAETVGVAEGASIRADGLAGAGGDVVLWADGAMTFRGDVSATGEGAAPGGFAEVSGGFLLFDGTADLRSDTGAWGELLLDPFNITISTAASAGMSGFTAGANNSILNATVLLNALATANVNVMTGTGGQQAGDITVATPLSWAGDGRLTLTAARNVAINRAITAPDGGLIINASGTITATGAVDVDFFSLLNGFWRQEQTAALPGFAANDFRVANDALFRRWRVIVGEGSYETVEDVYGLQGLRNEDLGQFDTIYVEVDIDAGVTAGWNNGAGFLPIGTPADPFLGQLVGFGTHIVDLTINRPTSDNVGLIGYSRGGSVYGLSLVDVTVAGRNNVGAFFGYLENPDSEAPFGAGQLGGSWATGTVTAAGQRAGGLVGYGVDAAINESWARVDVTGQTRVGGLVGEATYLNVLAFSTGIQNTYAVGDVTATGAGGFAGGLIGSLRGLGFGYEFTNLSNSYASGRVTAPVAGGLVGINRSGTGGNLYWDRQTTGQADAVGDPDTFNDVVFDNVINNSSGLTSALARDPDSYSLSSDYWYVTSSLRPMLFSTFSNNIYVPEELQLLRTFSFGSAALQRDMDMGSVLRDRAGIWGPSGWLPIGQGEGAYFGTFDGGGHQIDGLFINRPEEDYVGLFGTVFSDLGSDRGVLSAIDAQIMDVMLTNVDVTGGSYTGALIGLTGSTSVAQVYVSGQVEGSGSYTGGLIGAAFGGTIDNALSLATVVGEDIVGGLVGSIGEGQIVARSYAQGNVSGVDAVGGLVGFTEGFSFLDQTFATGRVTGATFVGGLVGQNNGEVTASFWDRTSTGRANAFGQNTAGPQEAVSLTTAQFQDTLFFMSLASTYDWDFQNDWAPPEAGFYPANYTIEPVVYQDGPSLTRTYGASNAGLVPGPLYGGPGSYVFDEAGDTFGTRNVLNQFGPTLGVGFYRFGSLGGLTSLDGLTYRVVSTDGLTITPAPLTLSIDDLMKIYGNADPELTFALTGFVNGEGTELLTGSLVRAAGENVGSYVITPGTLSAGANYTITSSGPGSFLITPRGLTIAADDLSMFFGDAVPDLTFVIVDGQLVFGDTLSGVLAAGDITGPGFYTIGQGTLTAGGNYTITFDPGVLTVTGAARPSGPLRRSTDGFIPIDFDTDTLEDPFFAPPTVNNVGDGYTTEGTDAIVDQLQQATAYCSVIGQSEYVVDCLSERLAVIAAGLPQSGDYADARAALNAAAGRLSELVAENQDSDFPANLTRSLRPDAPPSSRPLRPVRTDNLADTLAAASGILAETQTQLLRSASASQESVHYQRIATAVGSTNTILLRSS
jgi:filamentous hemagglutinin family protein